VLPTPTEACGADGGTQVCGAAQGAEEGLYDWVGFSGVVACYEGDEAE
jgi:hypothetical protein